MAQMRRVAFVPCRYLLLVYVAAVVVQFFVAGAGVFRAKPKAGEHLFESATFDTHRGLGWILIIGSLVLLLLALLAWFGRRQLVGSAVLFVLLIVQSVLGGLGEDAPVGRGAPSRDRASHLRARIVPHPRLLAIRTSYPIRLRKP